MSTTGPVLGGLISQYFGSRAIFYFLTVLGSISLFTIILFLPETLRTIAGNGSVRLRGINKPLISLLRPQKGISRDSTGLARNRLTWEAIYAPLFSLAEKDIFVILVFGGFVYTVWSMVTSSTTPIFQKQFGLNEVQLGLAFLPNGIGCVTASYAGGWL